MSHYLVTGGAGFIGSHLSEELVGRGHRVRAFDNLSTGKRKNLEHLPGVELLVGDLANLEDCRRAVRGVDYVLHMGAIASVPRSVVDPIASNTANIDGSLNILVAARDEKVRRVVYAGSSSAYGDAPTLPKHEDMPTRPQSPYALQKLVAEQYCQLFTQLYGLETVTIRYFNVFGPRQDPGSPYSGVISLFSTALLEGRRPTIFGDGGQTRDFTYVANVVDANILAATRDGVSGRAFNVACGKRTTLLELATLIERAAGAAVARTFAEARAGDIKDSVADIARATRDLGFVPGVGVEEGLKRLVDHVRRGGER